MLIDLSVDRIAGKIAEQFPSHASDPRNISFLRSKYNVKVAAFNLSTIALISTVALLIITSKLLFLALAAVALVVRTAVSADLSCRAHAGGPARAVLFSDASILSHFKCSSEQSKNWSSNEVVVLDHVVVKNLLPSQESQGAAESQGIGASVSKIFTGLQGFLGMTSKPNPEDSLPALEPVCSRAPNSLPAISDSASSPTQDTNALGSMSNAVKGMGNFMVPSSILDKGSQNASHLNKVPLPVANDLQGLENQVVSRGFRAPELGAQPTLERPLYLSKPLDFSEAAVLEIDGWNVINQQS